MTSGFDRKAPIRLGGATRKEKTRDELLEEIKAERAERGDAKRRAGAALVIQRYWRGHAARAALRSQLLSAFLAHHSPLVANQQHVPSVEDVVAQLVPPALFLLVPQARRQQQAAGSGPTQGSGPGSAPLTLLPAASRICAAAGPGNNGAPPPHQQQTSLLPVARCLLALLMRSCSSADSASCCLALGLDQAGAASSSSSSRSSSEVAARWQRQAPRLLGVCCRLVCCLGGDGLVDAAAVRLLGIMTDSAQWKCTGAGTAESRAQAAARLRLALAADPWPLLSALTRLMAAATSAAASATSSCQAAGAAAAASSSPRPAAPAAVSPAAQLQKLQPLVAAVLQEGLRGLQATPSAAGTAAGSGGGTRASASALVAACAQTLLLGPGACEQLSENIRAQLRSPGAAAELCRAMSRVCASSRQAGRAGAAAAVAAGTGCLWALANLTQLLTGPYTSTTLPNGKQIRVLVPSPRGMDTEAALAYSAAVSELLPVAAQLLRSLGSSGAASSRGTKDTKSTVDGTGRSSGPASTSGSSSLGGGGASKAGGAAAGGASAAAAAEAASALWPLGQRGFLMQILDSLESVKGSAGMEHFAVMCDTAIRCLPEIGKAIAQAGQQAADLPSLLNTLAFAPRLLPRLWRWLGPALGLPIEAPLAATRGLDIASLAHGFRDMPRGQALVLGLFCRLFHHLLLVLDDDELYQHQQPMSLGQARAVATSLNSLVFHTYLPKLGKDGAAAAGSTMDSAPPLLAEYAPLLLRSLYERDVRKSFCQPLLWLAPYREMFGNEAASSSAGPSAPSLTNLSLPALLEAAFNQQLGALAPPPPPSAADSVIGGFNAAAVVQTLVQDGEAAAGPEDAEALQSRAGEGSRPASLAALLRTAPQAVPFAQRVELFRALLEEDKRRGGYGKHVHEGGVPPIKLTVQRSSVMEDTFRGLAHLGPALKARLSVTFINEQGLSEAGLDYGGLMKELLEEVVSRGFNPDFGLFVSTSPEGLIYPRPSADKVDQGTQLLEFLGLMVGKALYEGILINVALAPFFVARLQGLTPMFDDLATLDPALHRSLLQVKRYEGDVQDLGLTFCAEDDFFGTTTHHDLLPGWGDTPVTADNRLLYCHLLADWHLNIRLGRAAEAFARGLAHLIPPGAFRLFNPKELNQLLSGGSEDGQGAIDLDDLRKHVRYSGGYTEDSNAVKIFWKVLGEMTPHELGMLLKFVTSCSRAPLGGFKYLHPPLTIHKVDCEASFLASIGGKDVDRLPSASTCFNMLKLPNYRRGSSLKQKLLQAISSGAGFELS